MRVNKTYTFSILFCFIFISASFGQTESSNDSLRLVWNDLSEPDSVRFKALNNYCIKNTYSAPQEVLTVSAFHYDLAISKDFKKESAKALENRAIVLCVQNNCDKAILEMEKAIDILIEISDSTRLAGSYNNIGTIYYSQSKFQEAIKYFSLSQAMFEQQNIEKPLGDIINNIGLIYYDINSFDFALEYFNKALEMYKKVGILQNMGNIWLNIGAIHLEKGDTKIGTQHIRKALKILKSQDHLYGVADCYSLLAIEKQKTGQIDSAFFYVEKSLSLNEEIGVEDNILADKTLIADLTFETDVDQATLLAKKVLALCDNDTETSIKKNIYKLLYKCYKKKGNTSQALAMHENYLIQHDSLLVEDDQVAVVRSAIQSDFDYKLFENKLQNEQAQAQLELNNLRRTYLILLIGLILILSILFIARSRIRAHRQQRETLLEEIEQLKRSGNSSISLYPGKYQLDKTKIEESTSRKINETDWIVLNILLNDPVISNKQIAAKAFMTADGIGSSLRRMYGSFDIKESKYKKISLIMEAIKISNNLT